MSDHSVVTKHQYLDRYPVDPEATRMIVGTIHPHDHEKFKIPFFYGNTLALWKILNQIFPQKLGSPITLPKILRFLSRHKIAISDVILECRRRKNSTSDEDLICTRLNDSLIDQIKKSKIKEIFFTSGFGKNNAFKLFYTDLLNQPQLKLTKKIKQNRATIIKAPFERSIKLVALYSPSGQANKGISRSPAYLKLKTKYQNSPTPVKDFKQDYYKEKFRLI